MQFIRHQHVFNCKFTKPVYLLAVPYGSILLYKRILDNSRYVSVNVCLQVKKINIHPQYGGMRLDYDVAVLLLSENLQIGASCQQVALANDSNTYENNSAIVTGWGRLTEGSLAEQRTLRFYRIATSM